MKRAVSLVLALVMCFALVACGGGEGKMTTTVKTVTEEGNLILKASPKALERAGIVPGNEVLIEVGEYKAVMLYNNDVLQGQGIDQMWKDINTKTVSVFTYEGNFAETNNIAEGAEITITKIIQPAA